MTQTPNILRTHAVEAITAIRPANEAVADRAQLASAIRAATNVQELRQAVHAALTWTRTEHDRRWHRCFVFYQRARDMDAADRSARYDYQGNACRRAADEARELGEALSACALSLTAAETALHELRRAIDA